MRKQKETVKVTKIHCYGRLKFKPPSSPPLLNNEAIIVSSPFSSKTIEVTEIIHGGPLKKTFE